MSREPDALAQVDTKIKDVEMEIKAAIAGGHGNTVREQALRQEKLALHQEKHDVREKEIILLKQQHLFSGRSSAVVCVAIVMCLRMRSFSRSDIPITPSSFFSRVVMCLRMRSFFPIGYPHHSSFFSRW